jgi:hypothetical protein
MKTKAERFIDHVQNLLIQNKHTAANAPAVTAVWSLLQELEQASRAAVYVPDLISAQDAAFQFVHFLAAIDSPASDPNDAPAWLRAYVIAELETSGPSGLS